MPEPIITPETLLLVMNAAHLAYRVESPFEERGGIMLVGPPGTWKTTLIKMSFQGYSDKSFHTDITTKQLVSLRSQIADGSIRSLLFEEFAKIFARTNAGAGINVEKHIQALIEQGFSRASFENSALVTCCARAFVVGGLVYSEYEKRFTSWKEDGFARRWIWAHIIQNDPGKLEEAVEHWKKIKLTSSLVFSQPPDTIPYSVTKEEARQIRKLCQLQPGRAETAKLLHKVLCVLKWRAEKEELTTDPFEIIYAFSRCLGDVPARLKLPNEFPVVRKPPQNGKGEIKHATGKNRRR